MCVCVCVPEVKKLAAMVSYYANWSSLGKGQHGTPNKIGAQPRFIETKPEAINDIEFSSSKLECTFLRAACLADLLRVKRQKRQCRVASQDDINYKISGIQKQRVD